MQSTAISGMPTGTKLVALYDYEGNHSDELSFAAQDIILLEANPQVKIIFICYFLKMPIGMNLSLLFICFSWARADVHMPCNFACQSFLSHLF